jgi:glycosyltransferase involved in cell wall biosynthesis
MLRGRFLVARMPDRRYRVLFVCGHPVQYMSPLLRRMAQHPQLEISTVYCRLRGATAGVDPEFGTKIQWDIPLLDGYPWVEMPNKGTDSEGFWGLCNPGLWKFVRGGNFDAVFCLTGYIRASFWITYLASKFSRSAFVFGTDATTLTPLDQRMWKRPVKRFFWPFLYRIASQVIAPSTGTRDLLRSLGLPEERISLIPYVVDNDWWKAQSLQVDRNAVRASWGVSPDTAVVLYCAKLQPWKRPLDLVQAFAQANVANSLLLLAGDGPLKEELQAETMRLGVSNRVRFLGFVNQTQLPALYTAADMMVLPSQYDAFGVVVNEAMLCGCAVVASDSVGAARDLIAPIDPSFIYPCGDVDALSTLLRRILSDRPYLARFRAAAGERMKTWSPQEYVTATVEAVERAVSRIRPAS